MLASLAVRSLAIGATLIRCRMEHAAPAHVVPTSAALGVHRVRQVLMRMLEARRVWPALTQTDVEAGMGLTSVSTISWAATARQVSEKWPSARVANLVAFRSVTSVFPARPSPGRPSPW